MNGTDILAKLRAKKNSRTILKQMTVWWWCCAMFCVSWPRNCVTIPTLSHLDTPPYSAKSEFTEAESSQSKVFEVNMWTSHGKWKWSWRRSKISGKFEKNVKYLVYKHKDSTCFYLLSVSQGVTYSLCKHKSFKRRSTATRRFVITEKPPNRAFS